MLWLAPPLLNSVHTLAGNFLTSLTWNGAAKSWARHTPSPTRISPGRGSPRPRRPRSLGRASTLGTISSDDCQASTLGPWSLLRLSGGAGPQTRRSRPGPWDGSRGERLSSQHQGEQSRKGCLAPSAPLALRGVRALSAEGWSEGEEEAPNHGKH